MPAEKVADDTAVDTSVSPFVGGDPIIEEDLGTMSDLVESATDDAGRFKSIEPAELRRVPTAQRPDEKAPSMEPPVVEDTEADADQEPDKEPDTESTDVTPDDLEKVEDTADKADTEADTEAAKKPIMIPKRRLDQEAAKRRAAEAEAERYKKQLEEAQPFTEAPTVDISDVSDRVKKAFDNVLDGDLDAATQAIVSVIQDANAKVLEAARADTAKQVVAGTKRVSETRSLDEVITNLENTYEVFNQNSDQYNAELVAEVVAMQAGYVSAGHTAAAAMEKAANNALLLYGYAETAVDEASALPPAAPAKKKSVEKNIRAATQQPPELPVSTQDNARDTDIDVFSLTDDEFDALPESVQRRLRGDFV